MEKGLIESIEVIQKWILETGHLLVSIAYYLVDTLTLPIRFILALIT